MHDDIYLTSYPGMIPEDIGEMSMVKQWIVYTTPDNKTKAVEATHKESQCAELRQENNVVVGYVNFKDKSDAIDYANQVLLS